MVVVVFSGDLHFFDFGGGAGDGGLVEELAKGFRIVSVGLGVVAEGRVFELVRAVGEGPPDRTL